MSHCLMFFVAASADFFFFPSHYLSFVHFVSAVASVASRGADPCDSVTDGAGPTDCTLQLNTVIINTH